MVALSAERVADDGVAIFQQRSVGYPAVDRYGPGTSYSEFVNSNNRVDDARRGSLFWRHNSCALRISGCIHI